MSVFDPQGLYFHTTRSTKEGQVIQKKPNIYSRAVSSREIPRSLSVLKAMGYTVLPPDEPYTETYVLLQTNCLSYSNFATLQPGESFVVKYKDFLFTLIDRSEFNYIPASQVIQTTLELVTTQISTYSNSTSGTTVLNVKFANDNELIITKASGILRNLIFADNQTNKVNAYSFVGNSCAISWPTTNQTYPGILSWKYIDGDSQLYKEIKSGTYTLPQLDEAIVQLDLNGSNEYPLTEVAINFSVVLTIKYKTDI